MLSTMLILGVFGILAVLAGSKAVAWRGRGRRRPSRLSPGGDPLSGTSLARPVTPADYVPRERLDDEDFG